MDSEIANIGKGVGNYDLWVNVGLGDSYDSIYIFEAKNWATPVDKNEIIIFADKIAAARATTGFFVAKAFTQYAEAAARKHPRLQLLKATEDFDISDHVRAFHLTHQDRKNFLGTYQLVLKKNPALPPPPVIMKMNEAQITLNGAAVDYDNFVNSIMDNLVGEHLQYVPTHIMGDGVHSLTAEGTYTVAPDILMVNGYDVHALNIKVQYECKILRPPIISKFNIETRGRVHVFDEVAVGTFGYQRVSFVERDNGLTAVVVEQPL